ncbi:PH domain-containing protein [Actinomycetospora termitidis]|uniref:PH domain-containing protein n=1 Tax=Actinomycetospora termitidis TaxID=3053470 RepID=A0ABT7MBP0_9PSEU|nr:PH domain-containing protein [Actinomycetospora sp. Odt1-22]MDL5158091.1 PH domain-containing protein [Actinomycetospora sp. Odt1-22]
MTVPLRPPREPLDPRVRSWWRVHCLAWPVLLAVVLGVLGLLIRPIAWFLPVAGAVVVVGLLLAVAFPAYWYRVHRWEVTDDAVYTRSGFLWQEWRAAPLSRIQTVDTTRGPLQQAFGLSALVVTTASSRGAVTVVGLDHERAAEIAERLTRATQAVPGDAT